MAHEDSILLKIHREFTQDEAVKFLEDALRKAKFSNGELKSEVAELNDIISKQNKLIAELQKGEKQKLTKDDLKEARFIELNKNLETKQKHITQLKKDVDLWRSKYLNLTANKQH